MLPQTNTILTAPADVPTCDMPGCTYSGSAFYFRGDNAYCGACMDRLDDEDMPHLTSEYAWQLLRRMDD